MSIDGKSTGASEVGEGVCANQGIGDPEEGVGAPVDDFALIPPRYWWLKRLSIASGVLIVALVVLWLWWGWAAERRLADQIARYRAEGQLVYPEEIDAALADIPDEENAAILYERAAEKMVSIAASGESLPQFVNQDEPGFLAEHLAAAKDLVEANAETLTLVHQARSLKRVRWPCSLADMAADRCFPDLSSQRFLAKFLSVAVRYYVEIGDYGSATRTMQGLWAQATAIGASPALIGRLVSVASQQLVVSSVEAVGARIGAVGESPGAGGFVRNSLFHVIASLLDEATYRSGIEQTVASERAYGLGFLRSASFSGGMRLQGAPMPPLIDWFADVAAAPIQILETVRSNEYADLWGLVLSQPTWPAGVGVVPASEGGLSSLRSLSRPFSDAWFGSGFDTYLNVARLCFQSLAHRRLAATALAIRLYELDHEHRPPQLQALVPDYLPFVPDDPFARDSSPIRFTRGEHGDVVYSVYLDGRDDDGVEYVGKRGGAWDKLDLVLYLDGRPQTDDSASAPSSTEAREDKEDVDDSGGERDEGQSGEGEPE